MLAVEERKDISRPIYGHINFTFKNTGYNALN